MKPILELKLLSINISLHFNIEFFLFSTKDYS